MIKRLDNKIKKSFTLVEMLVSVSLISFVFLSAAGIYTFSINLQRKSAESTALQQEANYLLSLITKDIRQNIVNYDYYRSSIPQPTSGLALINYQRNQTILYHLSSDKKIMKNVAGSGDQPINSSEVEVTILQFYISPPTDPFVNSSGTSQPRVTIVLELKSKKGETLRFQQTVIQRYSERK